MQQLNNIKNTQTVELKGFWSYQGFNYLNPASYFTYHQLLHSKILHGDYSAFMCFVWLSGQTVTFVSYIIN
jgi:hypothetical protein